MKLTNNKAKQAAMDLAEDSRQADWHHPSFVGELFKGSFRWDLIHPYPLQDDADKQIGDAVLRNLKECLKTHVDPVAVDRDQHLPQSAIDALAAGGYFGMKIPKKYGGLGLSVTNYARAMELVGSWCGTTAVWLSAHQSIGVPQPLKMFGTDAQKEKYLPLLAKGAISAFALTEPNVGSDPAKMSTFATPSKDGKVYSISGEKLYITNGPAADYLVVMAVTPPVIVHGREKKQITAFIVDTKTPGFEVLHECQFLGIRGIRNGWLKFTDVKVPKENIIGGLGQGLRIALATLNTGRLTIPAISAGAGKVCMHYCEDWVNERVQWGNPIGKHQAVSVKLARMAADTFAMDAVSFLTTALADKDQTDIRIEAAISKYFASEVACATADEALQIRGGRGFETETSLKNRGDTPFPIERMLRDLRINRIIEGTSEIMHLFIAREAMDVHVKTLFSLMSPKFSIGQKVGIAIKAGLFYLTWYPRLWLPRLLGYKTQKLNIRNRYHLSYIGKTARKLARHLFHTMIRFGPKLEKEQVILSHYVDIGTRLFAMAASLSKADALLATHPDPKSVQQVVDLFCQQSRTDIDNHFRAISSSSMTLSTKVRKAFMNGRLRWMVDDVMVPE